jgi:sn-2 palmitoyl-lipid 9-desaturase
MSAGTPRHRARASGPRSVIDGSVRFNAAKFLWLAVMVSGAVVGGLSTLSLGAALLFLVSTGCVLLFGHSLGSHRKLIHDSFQCPCWLERVLVYLGVLVGLDGPLGLLRQHELRDYSQRQPRCHAYLRHGSPLLVDAWWQLCCTLHLHDPPQIRIEPRIADDAFYRFLQRTWMAQQLPLSSTPSRDPW